jgi:hypothetical protein
MADRAGVAITVALIGAAATVVAALIAAGVFRNVHFDIGGSGSAGSTQTVVVVGSENGTGSGTGSEVSKGPSAEQIAAFIRNYYGQLPAGVDTAWSQLSPGYQAQSGGYSGYTAFWSGIRSVRVDSVTSSDYRTSVAGLTYVHSDGKTQSEKRWLRVEYVNGQLRITASGL